MFDQVMKTPSGEEKKISLPAAARFVEDAEGLLEIYQ